MIRTFAFSTLACAVLAACTPAIPDSAAGVPNPGQGVGFDNSVEAQRQRDAQLAQQQLPAPAPVGSTAIDTPVYPAPVRQQQTAAVASSTTQQTSGSVEDAAARQRRSANSGVAPVEASPSNAPPPILNNPGISDEQDFDAVASRQSIESDAARIAANRAQYQQVQPTALPSRGGAGQTNIVAYALQTSHAPGTKVHQRLSLNSRAKYDRNCAAYASDDLAQIDFLERGGPRRDRKGLDPDGDGYACNWDPTPFRRAASN